MNEENKNLSNNPINRASMPKGVDDKENSFAPPEAVNSDVDIKKLTEEIEKDPKNPYCYFERGEAYKSLNEYEKAIEDFSRAIELYNKDYTFFWEKGACLHFLSEYDEAIEFYTKAIELEPNNAQIFNDRGLAFDDKKDYVSAIENFKTAIKLDPQDSIFYFNLSGAFRYNKEYEMALYYVNRAIEMSPEYVDFYCLKGKIYESAYFYRYAINNITDAIELDDKFFDAYRLRSKLYYILGEDDKAIADSKKMIELEPNNGFAYGNYICNCENFAKRYKDAIMCCKEALKLDNITTIAKNELRERIKSLKRKLRDECCWYKRLHRWLKSQSWYPFAFILVYSLVFSIAWTAIYQHVFGYKFDICYILTSKFFVVVFGGMFYSMLYNLVKVQKILNPSPLAGEGRKSS